MSSSDAAAPGAGAPLRPWKTLARRVLCRVNRFLSVELHEVELPDGRKIPDWPWLVTPDYANVLARTTDGRFLCFRQPKYAAAGLTLAPVGGFLEPGEDPLAAARRELREETGYEAPEWHALGHWAVDANRGNGTAHLFLALDAVPRHPRHVDDLEQQEMLTLTRPGLEQALEGGEFKVLAWAALVAMGLRFLDRRTDAAGADRR